VSLFLEHWGLLRRSLLYLSLFFKRRRAEYHRMLGIVRTDGDWEAWLDFFLDGVATVADEAAAASRDLFTLVSDDRQRLLAHASASVGAIRLFELLPKNPIVSSTSVMRLLDTTRPAAGRALDALVEAGLLVETTGRRRDRPYTDQRYLVLLREGTELEDR
jgi:Fic family protein